MPRNVYGPDHEAFRSSVREFVERTLKPRAEQMLEVKSVDRDIFLIKDEILHAPAIGSFNLHPAPLPRYAGLNSVSWAIPSEASSSSESSWAREKGRPSAVPWTSTRSPDPVTTTLKSTSARASSS